MSVLVSCNAGGGWGFGYKSDLSLIWGLIWAWAKSEVEVEWRVDVGFVGREMKASLSVYWDRMKE